MPDTEVMIRPRLKELCEQQNITLYRLAKDIGRAPNTITRIANGERGASRQVMSEICRRLNCQPGDIFVSETL